MTVVADVVSGPWSWLWFHGSVETAFDLTADETVDGGTTYPGGGDPIGASMLFSHLAALDMAGAG